MKRSLCVLCVFSVGGFAFAQDPAESDVTTIKTTTRVVGDGGPDLLAPLWSMTDAVPVPTGRVDLRFNFAWETASSPASLGDSDDDFIMRPAIVWGIAENWEVWAYNEGWLGDAGNRGPFDEGNFDTYLGFLYRFRDQEGYWPAMAIAGEARTPTCDGSNGLDGELRLVMTNDYDNGLRSHVNVFGITVNNDNDGSLVGDEDEGFAGFRGPREVENRNVQWGVVVGMDGPLGDDGCLRWVADYVHRSSRYTGNGNLNMVELGWEWKMSDVSNLGMAVVVGLDGVGETPNFGAGMTYSHSIRN